MGWHVDVMNLCQGKAIVLCGSGRDRYQLCMYDYSRRTFAGTGLWLNIIVIIIFINPVSGCLYNKLKYIIIIT